MATYLEIKRFLKEFLELDYEVDEENDLKITSIKESQQVLVNALEQYHASMNCRNDLNVEIKNYVDMLLSNVEKNRKYIDELELKIRNLEKRLDEVEK